MTATTYVPIMWEATTSSKTVHIYKDITVPELFQVRLRNTASPEVWAATEGSLAQAQSVGDAWLQKDHLPDAVRRIHPR